MIGDAELFQTPETYGASTAVGAVDGVALLQQELGEVGTVLAGDTSDDGCIIHCQSPKIQKNGKFEKQKL